MIVNLTPHAVRVMTSDGKSVDIPPSGQVARVAVARTVVGAVRVGDVDVPIHRTSYGAVQGLPAPKAGTLYLVSLAVRQACPGRTDLASPGELVRDAAGQPIGCRGFDV